MDSARPFLIPLDKVREEDERIVGGKAVKLGLLAQAGFTVPKRFCVTTWAYEAFVNEHKIIIAREFGIPCVNGVRKAADVLHDGDLVTVDGHLGIVTVGAAEFDFELRAEIDENNVNDLGS